VRKIMDSGFLKHLKEGNIVTNGANLWLFVKSWGGYSECPPFSVLSTKH
jgi:hypothetical protein